MFFIEVSSEKAKTVISSVFSQKFPTIASELSQEIQNQFGNWYIDEPVNSEADNVPLSWTQRLESLCGGASLLESVAVKWAETDFTSTDKGETKETTERNRENNGTSETTGTQKTKFNPMASDYQQTSNSQEANTSGSADEQETETTTHTSTESTKSPEEIAKLYKFVAGASSPIQDFVNKVSSLFLSVWEVSGGVFE